MHGKNTSNVIFSFTPIKIKLYTMKVPMKSSIFGITSFFEKTFEYANKLYTNRICPKYTQIGLIFFFTPTTIKLYIMVHYHLLLASGEKGSSFFKFSSHCTVRKSWFW